MAEAEIWGEDLYLDYLLILKKKMQYSKVVRNLLFGVIWAYSVILKH